jgi:hypothetical protein
MTTARRNTSDIIKYGMLAGAAGGLAEIAWVSLYAAVTGGDAAILARGVTTAVGVTALLPAAPVAIGITVHMLLAVVLGVALAGLWQALSRTQSTGSLYGVALAVLAGVWVFNFFVALPLISPAFVHLVPYPVSLLSKLLFGLAAAETLRRCAMVTAARVPVRVRAASTTRHPAP